VVFSGIQLGSQWRHQLGSFCKVTLTHERNFGPVFLLKDPKTHHPINQLSSGGRTIAPWFLGKFNLLLYFIIVSNVDLVFPSLFIVVDFVI
jgi:hypothetical protein